MYYVQETGGRRKLVSPAAIPVDIMGALSPDNPVDTDPEKILDAGFSEEEVNEIMEDVKNAFTDDDSIETKAPEKLEPEPEEEEEEKTEEFSISPNVCLFDGNEGEKIKRVNMMNFLLCESCFYEKTPGKIVEKYNNLKLAASGK